MRPHEEKELLNSAKDVEVGDKIYCRGITCTVGQILDLFDYISNFILMPLVAITTCILIGWIKKPQTVIDEITIGGVKFSREKLYVVMIKYITPVMLLFLLLQA